MSQYGIYYPTTPAELYEYVSELDIFLHYVGDFEEAELMLSPLRDEKTPSFRIDYYNDRWVWRDFYYGVNWKDAIEFVKINFSLTFIGAIHKIYHDLFLNNIIPPSIDTTHSYKPKNKTKLNVHFELQLLRSSQYWDLAQITPKKLNFYKVRTGSIWINGKRSFNNTTNNPLFIYRFGPKIFKGYQPLVKNKKYKWFSHNIDNHVQNSNNLGLTGSDILFITKSYKDCIVLNELGYDAIAPHAESLFIDVELLTQIRNSLKYKAIFILYDNDQTGINKAERFSKIYSIPHIILPNNLPMLNQDITKFCKDSWDIVVNYDYQTLEDILLDEFIKFNI